MGRVLAAVALGGVCGSAARYGLTLVLDGPAPWATFAANVTGCALIGVLMVLVLDVWSGHRLLRPFVGVGVLGGYTTFSTYAVEVLLLAERGHPLSALAYLAGTVVAALVAVQAGVTVARLSLSRARARRRT